MNDTNNLLRESQQGRSHKQKQKPIIVTKCLSPECTGFYTDSISESILIRCMDPRHLEQGKRMGVIRNEKGKFIAGGLIADS